jgi:hypothetical protein
MKQEEGTMQFTLRHPEPDWSTNSLAIDFGVLSMSPLSVRVLKPPDCMLIVEIDGPGEDGYLFHVPLPAADPKGILARITWDKEKINLYLNGSLAQAIPR